MWGSPNVPSLFSIAPFAELLFTIFPRLFFLSTAVGHYSGPTRELPRAALGMGWTWPGPEPLGPRLAHPRFKIWQIGGSPRNPSPAPRHSVITVVPNGQREARESLKIRGATPAALNRNAFGKFALQIWLCLVGTSRTLKSLGIDVGAAPPKSEFRHADDVPI